MTEHTSRRSAYRFAAVATLIGLAGAVAPGAAQADPARSSAALDGGVLAIRGTAAADMVTIDFTTLGSIAVDLGQGAVERFDSRTVSAVSVDLGSGDDHFDTRSGGTAVDKPLTLSSGSGDDHVVGGAGNDTIDGGSGDDVLLGGAGTDLLVGGRGSDFVNGGVGTDTELLGSGDDTAGWNPGDGNDAVTGGLGHDTLAFNGSDGDERMSLTADGHSAVFFRSPGNIRMDLDGVEQLDLAAFGGVDAVTIGDLTGTALVLAHLDLAAAAGGADGKADTVVVNGTDASDRVHVSQSARSVDVSGLATRIVVSGSEPADQLQVNTGGGDDRVAVDPGVNALIAVGVDLGAGQL